jgi:hypothetical protein
MRALFVVLVAWSGVAYADGKIDRAAIKAHQAERAALRARLEAASGPEEHVKGTLFHQIREPAAQAEWAAKVNDPKTSLRRTLKSWIPMGGYPGIWTVEDGDGFYRGTAGKPFEVKIKPGAILFDADKPEHRAVYEEWVKLDARTRGPNAENRFDAMKSADGRPLSKRVSAVHAPTHERFYREMNIAGVGYWHDSYGQRSVVVLNPNAVESVKAPSE